MTAEQQKVQAISNELAMQLDGLQKMRKRIKSRELRNVIIQAMADLDMLICTLDDAVTTEES
jgi:hypothetical protein